MANERTVIVVDDDDDVRGSLEMLIRRSGYRVKQFGSARAFLEAGGITANDCCVLADIRMPEMDGLTLQREINRTIPGLPVVIMTGHGDVPMAVQAMKDGAVEFLEKPFDKATLLSALKNAFERPKHLAQSEAAPVPRRALTDREQEVLDLLVEGHQNKIVAHKLGISTRTVEVHRGRIMEKLNAKNLADLVRFSIEKRGT